MQRQFPYLHTDGSFTVIATFSVAPGKVLNGLELENWFALWLLTADPWDFKWHTKGKVRTESVQFLDQFETHPQFIANASELKVAFKGRGTAKHWKNWLVRVTRAILNKYPMVLEFGGYLSPSPVS